MGLNDKKRETIEFAINGLTKSGSILYINIPAKIRPFLKKNAVYRVTLEEISELEEINNEYKDSY